MRRSAAIVAAFGALVAEALMLYAGRQNTHYLITALFIVWVASPFVLLFVADRYADNWPQPMRVTLAMLMLIITVATIVVYAARIAWPPRAQAAFVFVIVPPISWLLTAGGLGASYFVSRTSRS